MTQTFKKNKNNTKPMLATAVVIHASCNLHRLSPFITHCLANDLSFEISHTAGHEDDGGIVMQVRQLPGAVARTFTFYAHPTPEGVAKYANDYETISGRIVSEFCPPAVRSILLKDGVQTQMVNVAYWKRQRITVADCSLGNNTTVDQTAHYWLAFSARGKELGRFQDGLFNAGWKDVESVTYGILPEAGPCVTIEYQTEHLVSRVQSEPTKVAKEPSEAVKTNAPAVKTPAKTAAKKTTAATKTKVDDKKQETK